MSKLPLFLILLVFLVVPVVAFDIECASDTGISKNFNPPDSDDAVFDVELNYLHFKDIGERMGFYNILVKNAPSGTHLDAEAPNTAYTTVIFKNEAETTTYGTGVIGYNYLLDELKYQVYVYADGCGMFQGMDGTIGIKLVYNHSAIYNLHFDKSSGDNFAAQMPADGVAFGTSAVPSSSYYGWGTTPDSPIISNDCYDMLVGIDVALNTPNTYFNEWTITRDGWDATVTLNDSVSAQQFYGARNTIDSESVLIPVGNWSIDYYIHLWGPEDECTGTYTVEQPPASTYTLTVYVRDLNTGNLLSGVNYIVHDVDDPGTGELHYQNRTNWYSPTNFDAIPNHDVNINVSKSGYTSDDTTINTAGTVDPLPVTIYLEPSCGAPANQTCMYFKTFWLNLAENDTTPLSGVSITANNQTKTSTSAGTAVFYVPVNTTYHYSASKSGYNPVEGDVIVTTVPVIELIIMEPVGAPTATPTPTTTVPVTTYPPGDVGGFVIGRLASIMGAWALAGLIIFSFMVGVAYYTQNGMAAIAGGAMGFVISVGLGLIAWIYFLLILAVVVAIIAIKIGGGLGGGTG